MRTNIEFVVSMFMSAIDTSWTVAFDRKSDVSVTLAGPLEDADLTACHSFP